MRTAAEVILLTAAAAGIVYLMRQEMFSESVVIAIGPEDTCWDVQPEPLSPLHIDALSEVLSQRFSRRAYC
jgi:hypothetical protein